MDSSDLQLKIIEVRIKMKQKVFTTILQWLVSLFCWLTVSPLFCYLAGRWKLMGKKLRVCLMLISPLFLIVYFILYLLVWGEYSDYRREHRFADKDVLTEMTGVAYPDYKVVEYTKYQRHFLGDYNDKWIIVFEETPSAVFYQSLDSLIATGNSDWSRDDNVYSFSGYDYSDDYEEGSSLYVCFKKGSKQATISYAVW